MGFLSNITRFIAILSLCIASSQASDPTELIPVSTAPPGGLTPAETPQLILITFDDFVNETIYDNILKITDHQNRDGSPMAMTFFVNSDNTDYYLINKLHAAGHEIAVHTMTHTTSKNTTFDTWIHEIEGCREALTRYAGIPRDQLIGFRTPYLAYNADTWKALSLLEFSYDTSVPETAPGLNTPDEAHYIWPYTLHDGLKQNAYTGDPPLESYPNLMEIPMWTLVDENAENGYHNMDPDVATEAELLVMLKNNFTTRYEGNRIPVGIYFHQAWLTHDKNTNALNDFLDWALAKPDVFVVGVGALAKWMHNPVSAATAETEGTFTVQTYTPIPEEQAIDNSFPGHSTFRSVENAAPVYPTPNTAFLKRIELNEPITFRVEETQRWGGTAYQAKIFATNAGNHILSDWKIEFEGGNNVMGEMWNGAYTQSGNTITVTPKYVVDIPPGETMVADFGANGDPGTFGNLTPTFWATEEESPQLKMEQGPSGNILQWNRVAPMYELQGRNSLTDGDWQNIQTLYGAQETPVDPSSPYLFYRLRNIQ